MSIEPIVASAATGTTPYAGGNAATTDFAAVMSRARESANAAPSAQGLLAPLLNLNAESTNLAATANEAAAKAMRPSELMTLTVKSHEFLFHCQLVSNVANRSADGLQQLFRQQS